MNCKVVYVWWIRFQEEISASFNWSSRLGEAIVMLCTRSWYMFPGGSGETPLDSRHFLVGARWRQNGFVTRVLSCWEVNTCSDLLIFWRVERRISRLEFSLVGLWPICFSFVWHFVGLDLYVCKTGFRLCPLAYACFDWDFWRWFRTTSALY